MFRPYRRASQFAVFLLMFAIPVLNLYEIYAVTGTFYAINIGGLGIADPSAILQSIFAAGQFAPPILFSVFFPVLFAYLFGRVWCGWMCPYHVISDGIAWLRAKVRGRIRDSSEPEIPAFPIPFKANVVRFSFLLLGTAAAGIMGIPVLNYVNAPGILSTEAMILVRNLTVSVEIGFIAAVLLVELLFLPRFWCRLFCPTGAVVSLFRAPFTLRVVSGSKKQSSPCCMEETCSAACPMGLAPYREGRNLLCTNCARCIDACRGGKGTSMLRFRGFQG
jgi:ferredoxin-type protein NapH